jgi:hypothetical protein
MNIGALVNATEIVGLLKCNQLSCIFYARKSKQMVTINLGVEAGSHFCTMHHSKTT